MIHIVHGGVVEMKRNAHDQNEEQNIKLEISSESQSVGGQDGRKQRKNDHRWKLVSDSGCSLLVPDEPDGIDIDYA